MESSINEACWEASILLYKIVKVANDALMHELYFTKPNTYYGSSLASFVYRFKTKGEGPIVHFLEDENAIKS